MNDDTNSLHPWIEPELEARLTALVLGEASDFERDELERIIAERPEVGLYRKRLEAMHRMLREVATGESGEGPGEWKLGTERRAAVLAQLNGSPRIAETKSATASKRSPWSISPRFLAVAATIVLVGLMLGLMFPASTGALRSKGGKSQWYDDVYAYETSGHDRERMRRALDEGWESPVPADAPKAVDGEAEELALADRAIRPPAPTSAPPAPPAEAMVETRSGRIGALNGTVALGSGGDLIVSNDPNSPKISIDSSGAARRAGVGGGFEDFDSSKEPPAKPNEPANSNFGTSTASPAPAKVGDREMALGLEGANTFTGGVTISGGGLVVSDPAPSTGTEVETRGTIGGRDNTTADKSMSLGTAAVPAPTTSTLALVDADDDGVDRLSRSKEMSELAESEVVQVQEGKDQRGLRRESLVAAAPVAGIVEGKKSSMYEFGTTDITLGEIPVTEVDADLLPPQPSAPIASPKPAPKPLSPAPAEVDLAIGAGGVLSKVGAGNLTLGAGNLTLNGGGVIAETPKSELQAGRNGYTGDTQVLAGTVSGSGSVALGGTSRTGEVRFNRFGSTTPAEPELAKRKMDGAAEDEKGGEFSEGEAPVVSVTATSSFSVSSTEVPQVKDINGVAMAIDGKNVMDFDGFVTVDENERTKDQAIRGELPSAIEQSGNASGTVNFGAGVSTIGNLSGFFEVKETSSSMDPETAERLKKMGYFNGDEAESNHLATAESGFEAPAKTDGRSRAAGVGGEAEQRADVSRMGRSVAVEKSMAQATELEVKRESTGDWGKAPVEKAPIDETVDLGGEISAGYMSDYIFYGTRMNVNEGDRDKADVPALTTADTDLNTAVFHVPPTFLSTAPPGANVADPFADPASAGASPALGGRTTAKQILESAGISFPEGASALYNAETSQLIVRNTPDQTELVEAYVDSVAGSDEKEGEHLFTRHFLGGANTLRGFDYRDVGQKTEVDKSVQDILAQTPQVGKDITKDNAAMDTLFAVVPKVVGGGAESGKRMIDSNVPEPAGALFPSLDDVIMRSDRSTPAALDETSPSAEPFSTFSLHVSDVSFQLAKASLASGKWPEAEKIRIEEFVNAFDYGDPIPAMDERVACRIDQAAHPFLQQRHLVRIALRTAEAGRSSGTPLRLTLLLDSSGSMERPDRRETLTRAVTTLAGLLGENDRITLVSFARQPRLVADAVPGNEAMKLAETVAALPSEGGTNLEAALQLAFEKAREHQEPNAQNRIVLLTDGAANLGDAKAESLGQRVEMMREAGIAFDAAGFGAEGLNDEILEALTRKGDGRYYLLDRPEDADDAFAKQIAGALRPAAKNVKVQVEFNPDRVKSYKLLGFEKHRLATEDFRNDAVDAAEMAAAEAGVAVYQVEPIPGGEGDLGSVSVRFRDLDSGEMIERRWGLAHLPAAPSAEQGGDAILLATVASQFAAKLAGGPLGDVVDLGELARLAAELPESERVKELRTMIEQARNLEGVSVSF